MIYYNGQIISPEKFRVPSYTISPFSAQHLGLLKELSCAVDTDFQILDKKFNTHEFKLSGKDAIATALSFYNLKTEDEVYIITTTGNKYVSSCVTNVISKYCQWSRELTEKTKLIFVIHEFGLIYPNMESLLDLNIPIIEDLAMSLFSTNDSSRIGKYGDFTIYSLPKFFPVQFGGVLQYNNDLYKKDVLNDEEQPFQIYLKKTISFFLKHEEENRYKRRINYSYYVKKFKELGIQTRFDYNDNETPSVFMFSSETIELCELKFFMQNNGVECSKFYGENAFFLPVHQNLNQYDLDYIFNLVKYFIYENG
jgi:dTDP-4-amino-4,6-dideoxygalactose transaminase